MFLLLIFGQISWMDFTAWSIFSLLLWIEFLYASSIIWLWNVFPSVLESSDWSEQFAESKLCRLKRCRTDMVKFMDQISTGIWDCNINLLMRFHFKAKKNWKVVHVCLKIVRDCHLYDVGFSTSLKCLIGLTFFVPSLSGHGKTCTFDNC